MRRLGSRFSGCLAADAIYNEKDPSIRVGMEAIFVIFTLFAGIGRSGAVLA
jgi:hypothetical protein